MNCYQFYQIIPVTLNNGERSIKANGMLDTRLDSIFITAGRAKQLCLKGTDESISLSNVMSSKKKTFKSKLVMLDTFSN